METVVHLIITGIISLAPLADGTWELTMHSYVPDHHQMLLVEEKRLRTTDTVDEMSVYCPNLQDESRCFGGEYEYCRSAYDAWPLHAGPNAKIEIKSQVVDWGLSEDPSFKKHLLRLGRACQTGDCGIPDKTKYPNQMITMHLKDGALVTTLLSKNEWAFDSNSGTSFTVAQELCFEFTIARPPLELALPGQGNTSWDATIYPMAPGGEIEVRLQNVVAGDIFPVEIGGYPNDHHVDYYFARAKQRPAPMVHLLRRSATNERLNTHSHRMEGPVLVRALEECKSDVLEKICDELNLPCVGEKGAIKGASVNCPPGGWDDGG